MDVTKKIREHLDKILTLQNSTWLGDHQVRPFVLLIPCVKPSKYGARANTLTVELEAITLECDENCQVVQNVTEINVDYTKVMTT